MVGLGLAYFGYRHQQPLAMRSLFRPLLGDRVDGWAGDVVDIAATVGTLFGVATSLGLGVMQLNAGLDHLFGVGVGPVVQLLLIALVTGIATVSVLMGLDAGIQRLSQANLLLAGVLLLFVLVVGSTSALIAAYVSNVGGYLAELPDIMSQTGTYEDVGWLSNWTLFYWAWWISWSPFVGMFIARVSRGRTVREFVLGVLLVPSLVSFLWFTVLGNTAIHLEEAGAQLAEVLDVDEALALFVLLDELPLPAVTSLVALALVLSFFVTSSDSGSYVIGILTAGGDQDPPTTIRVFWAVIEGLVAATLLLAGGLTALQAGAIATGLPFTVVILFAVWGITRGLRAEEEERKGRRRFPAAHIADATARERAFRAWEARLREEQRELDEEERSLEEDREDLEAEREGLDEGKRARPDRDEG